MSAAELAALGSALEILETIAERRKQEWLKVRNLWRNGQTDVAYKSGAFDRYLSAMDAAKAVRALHEYASREGVQA